MAKIAEVRLTIAAFIYAIEIDLRKVIAKNIIPNFQDLSFLREEEIILSVKNRFIKEFPGTDPEKNLNDAIDFIDFKDSYTTVLKNKEFFPDEVFKYIKSISAQLDLIIPIRNRVMHARPLDMGDFSTIWTFVSDIANDKSIDWSTTKDTQAKIENDPSYVFTLTLPSVLDSNDGIHNLPIPDFDETGFIGRRKDVDTISKLILGNNTVVSIIGDGGIGKTALALKVAYDLLDLGSKNPFDFIIWISAKSTMLTVSGIEAIENTFKDYSGVVEGISEILGVKTIENRLNEILEYFEVFNTLLIIDNLETIMDESIREFIRKAQLNCKILITSRIGLGELEFRYPLKGLSEPESIQLIRQFANIKRSEILNKLPNEQLVKIVSKLHYNPLALKWFVNSVETGISPDEVLMNTDDLLNFCLSNVYGKLGNNSKNILKTILAARKSLNDAQLVFLIGFSSLNLRKALNELFATTFISREITNEGGSTEISYQIPEFAKEYLLKNFPVDINFIRDINKKQKDLFNSISSINRVSEYNEFGVNALLVRNTNEKVTARLITEALKISKSGRYLLAIEKLDEAKSILPNYFEIYRVSAFIKATMDDILGAEQDYKLGLEIEPDNPRLLFFYAGFLLYRLDDIDNAIKLAIKLHELRPTSEYPTFLLARCFSSNGQSEEAIRLISNLIKTKNLTKANERIAYTDMISQLGYWGNEIIQKEGDFQKAIEKFLESFKIYEKCAVEKNYDERMIRSFCNTLKTFIKNVPKLQAEPYFTYLKQLLLKHDDQIALNQSKEYLYQLIYNAYGIEILKNVNKAPEFYGTINVISQTEHFAFILSQSNQRFFAGQRSFRNIEDFTTLKEGDKVGFDLGKNLKGECAVNIFKLRPNKN